MFRLYIIMVLLLMSTPIQAAEYALRAGGMWLTPSGTASLSANGVAGSQLDVKGQMNLKKDTLPYGDLSVEWGQHAFHLSWLKASFKGQSSDPALRFNFNGQAFFNPPYQFKVDVDMLDGGFTYFPLFVDRDNWRLRLGAELAVKSFRTRVRTSESTFSQAVSNSAMIPSFGVRMDASIKQWLMLSGRYSAFRMSGSSLRDVEVMFDINPLIWYSDMYTVNIFAGYRQMNIKLNASGNGQLQTNTTFKGPVTGLRLVY